MFPSFSQKEAAEQQALLGQRLLAPTPAPQRRLVPVSMSRLPRTMAVGVGVAVREVVVRVALQTSGP